MEEEKEVTPTKVRFNNVLESIVEEEKEEEKIEPSHKSEMTVNDKGDNVEFCFSDKKETEDDELDTKVRHLENENFFLKEYIKHHGLSVEEALGTGPKPKNKSAAELAIESLNKVGISKERDYNNQLGALLRLANQMNDEIDEHEPDEHEQISNEPEEEPTMICSPPECEFAIDYNAYNQRDSDRPLIPWGPWIVIQPRGFFAREGCVSDIGGEVGGLTGYGEEMESYYSPVEEKTPAEVIRELEGMGAHHNMELEKWLSEQGL